MGERRTGTAALLTQQVRYQNTIFWRTPIAAFFTLIFPLMFLVIFNLLFEGEVGTPDGDVSIATFFAPSLAVFAAASATYTNLSVATSIARDQGILKRVRGTPLPPWMYMAGRVGSAVWIALIAVFVMLAVGVVVYDVEVMARTLPAAAVTFVVGVASFAALGLALAAFIPTGDTAPAVANATLLPLAFISNVFLSVHDAPGWVDFVGDLFPLKHFVVPFQDAFSPFTTDAAFRWDHLAVVTLWGAAALFLALRYFQWEPRGGESPARGRRRRRRSAGAAAG